MDLEAVLFAAIALSAPALWVVAGVMLRAVSRRPRIRFLETAAVATVLIALGITTYVIAVVNVTTTTGFLPNEAMRVVFRAVLLAVSLYPFWWLWLYLTGRFDDGKEE